MAVVQGVDILAVARAEIAQHLDQPPRRQIGGGVEIPHPGDAAARDRHLAHHLARIAEERPFDGPLDDPPADPERPGVDAAAEAELQAFVAGKIRGIAVTTLRRSTALPELPTIAESGLPGYEADNWYGIVTTAGTQRPIINYLNTEIVRALQLPDVKELLFKQGLEVRTSTPAECVYLPGFCKRSRTRRSSSCSR